MKKLVILLMAIVPVFAIAQYTTTTNAGANPSVNLNAASGSATYVIRPGGLATDCNAYNVSRAYKIGDGSGRVELCVTDLSNLNANCGGGNNKEDRLWVWTDQNGDGNPDALYAYWNNGGLQINALGPAFTDCQNCVMSPAGSGYLWVDFCPESGCSAADKAINGVSFTWNSYPRSANDPITSAEPIDTCSVSFTANNYDATPGSCGGYQANWNNNLDCNTSTALSPNPPTETNGGAGGGGDVGYSVENDIWYTFNPGLLGVWTLTFTPGPCYASNGISSGGDACDFYNNGFQYALFEGTSPTNFTNLVSGGTNGQNITAAQVIPINVTNLATTYYLEIEGYAGVGCRFTAVLTPPGAVCTLLPLPIQLTSFTANLNSENGVDLSWITASEKNNDYFTIERSRDGEVFEWVGTIDGSGTSSRINTYDMVDFEPYNGTSYYRLKQTDYDGKFSYSDLAVVRIDNDLRNIKVYPNPVEGVGYLSFDADISTNTTIVIHDISGRKVFSEAHLLKTGNNTFTFNTESLTRGMYFLSLDDGVKSTTIKFIKD